MRFLLLLACGSLLCTACSDTSTNAQAPSAESSGAGASPELAPPHTDPGPSTPARPLTAEPLGVVIRTLGESDHGTLRVVVEETEAGRLAFMVHHVTHDQPGERYTSGAGSTFAEDPSAPWLIYLHTPQEIYAYDGRGGLHRQTFTFEDVGVATAERPARAHHENSTLTLGPTWNPGEELRASLPKALIELIEGA